VNKFGFTGPFSDEMNDFILLKRSVGNKYEAEVGVLKSSTGTWRTTIQPLPDFQKSPSSAGVQATA